LMRNFDCSEITNDFGAIALQRKFILSSVGRLFDGP